ncbi:MAG: YceD family protein [Bacillota bacterium]
MRINVAELKKNPGMTLEAVLNEKGEAFDYQGEEISFHSPVYVVLTVKNNGRIFPVAGTIKTELEMLCGRCLEKFIFPIQTEFMENFRQEGILQETLEDGNKDEEEEIRTYVGDAIDLGEAVQEAIFLALPMKAVCTSECRGLCPVCGANRNHQDCICSTASVDHRFEVLKKLFDK